MHMASSRLTNCSQGRLVSAYALSLCQRSEETLILWSQSQSHRHVAMIPKWYHEDMPLAERAEPEPSAPGYSYIRSAPEPA